MTITVYHYPKCSSCRRALKWLDAAALEYRAIDLGAAPPSKAKLKQAWKRSGMPLKKFFNTAGQSYRQGGFKDRLATMSEAQQLEALAADGMLIKRPLLIADDCVLLGFKEEQWQALRGR